MKIQWLRSKRRTKTKTEGGKGRALSSLCMIQSEFMIPKPSSFIPTLVFKLRFPSAHHLASPEIMGASSCFNSTREKKAKS